jgi:zinc transport system substrate-binding protein
MMLVRSLVLALALMASLPLRAAEAPAVVASIKPVHSLVAGVMAGIGEPHLLVRGGASPHASVLKPSDARALAGADLVFWIGRDLETPLVRPLASLAGQARVVALSRRDGLVRYPVRSGTVWGGGDHDKDKGNERGAAIDMHLWLDPANAVAMVDEIAGHLAALDPARAAAYRANATAVTGRLRLLDDYLRDLLTDAAGRPYIVYHDAYRYFEERYGLTPLGAVSAAGHRTPGAARLRRIRRIVVDRRAACIFAEPQFAGRSLNAVSDGTEARVSILDPLGAALRPGPDQYVRMMRDIAVALRDCLVPSG